MNSQFDSNHPFKVPKPPPNKLVNSKSFNVPNISFLPAIPKENFPPKIKSTPSIKKLKIGTITIAAIINEAIFKSFKSDIKFFVCLIKIFLILDSTLLCFFYIIKSTTIKLILNSLMI